MSARLLSRALRTVNPPTLIAARALYLFFILPQTGKADYKRHDLHLRELREGGQHGTGRALSAACCPLCKCLYGALYGTGEPRNLLAWGWCPRYDGDREGVSYLSWVKDNWDTIAEAGQFND